MRQYDTALNVIVSPDEYPKLMSHVKDQFAIIVLMVDILDFPCSVWPSITDIIGKKCLLSLMITTWSPVI